MSEKFLNPLLSSNISSSHRLGPHIHFLYENSQTGSNLCTLDKCTKDQEEIN